MPELVLKLTKINADPSEERHYRTVSVARINFFYARDQYGHQEVVGLVHVLDRYRLLPGAGDGQDLYRLLLLLRLLLPVLRGLRLLLLLLKGLDQTGVILDRDGLILVWCTSKSQFLLATHFQL